MTSLLIIAVPLKGTKKENSMSTTGEKPGAGTYKCDNCAQIVVLDDDSDTLPPCPKCEETEYTP